MTVRHYIPEHVQYNTIPLSESFLGQRERDSQMLKKRLHYLRESILFLDFLKHRNNFVCHICLQLSALLYCFDNVNFKLVLRLEF